MKTLTLITIALLMFSCGKTEKIGEIYEGEKIINISLVIPTEKLKLNDTVFFIVKNDTTLICGNTGNLYIRRYKYD